MNKKNQPTPRKRLAAVTWVLGDKPCKTISRQLLWAENAPIKVKKR